ncbi:protein takeout-like [Thrips palmi]|uniref:Protein takeout-like n=1 Tax=Thrips palmi TaxID=161013 RepID=A0A6P8ZWP1_THRPL|nr:protein takeout-like [Thrips palmi]
MARFLELLVVGLVGLALGLALADAAKLPAYFRPKCSRRSSDEVLSACVQKVANQGVSSLANGDKKLGIPSMRPLVVPRMALSQGTSTVGLNITWEPAEIWGLGESRLYNYKTNYANKSTHFDVLIPSFTLSGTYRSSGRVLLLPIHGNGPSNVTVTNLRVHYYYEWPTKKNADGKEYFYIPKSDINIIGADAMYINFDNLFNGDQTLGNSMNLFLNENWRELLKELGPGMAEAVGGVVLLVVKRLSELVPADDFWADR